MSDDSVFQQWNERASAWDKWVGVEGDRNRRENSDPVIWRWLGTVDGLEILDAGCGTGYLSIQMAEKGAKVTGIDFAPKMVEIAMNRAKEAGVEARFTVDSASVLKTQKNGLFDCIVSNYVLMDLPDLTGASEAFFRALKPGGLAIVVINHPCFMVQGGPKKSDEGVRYDWTQPYFDGSLYEERWGPFQQPFTSFHRPLSEYWRAFQQSGFVVADFAEPVAPRKEKGPKNNKHRWIPNSVAFCLKKPE